MYESIGWRALTASALLGVSSLALVGCGERDANRYYTDLFTVESMRVERVVSDESALFFVELDVHNRTRDTANNFFWARVRAGSVSSEFDLTHNEEPFTLVGCLKPEPFDVPPGQTMTTRMRIDLQTDPARFDVACEFDPSVRGFTSSQSRGFWAPRSGTDLPSDFLGPVELQLKGTLNGECGADDCPHHVLVVGSSEVSAP